MIDYRPRNPKELFNLRHAHLRNAIERIFGVLKKRYKILLLAQEYSLQTQAQIVPALTALHNFIAVHDPTDISEYEDEDEVGSDSNDSWGGQQAEVSRDERTRAARRRDLIADRMWNEYTTRAPRRCR
jgi:hypothetical protein